MNFNIKYKQKLKNQYSTLIINKNIDYEDRS